MYCLIGFLHFSFCPFCVVLGINERNGEDCEFCALCCVLLWLVSIFFFGNNSCCCWMLMADAIYVFIHNVTPTLVEDCSVCQICEVSWCTNPKKIKKLVQFLRGWDGPTTLRIEGECAFMLKIKILYILFCMCVYFLKNKGLITVWKCVFLKKY